jgi:hypothetical protein
MTWELPLYTQPDFSHSQFQNSPTVEFRQVEKPGVAPDNYHATSIYPEYYHMPDGGWHLPSRSRMDCVVVREKDNTLWVKEFRNLREREMVACGRNENGEDGIYVHAEAFSFPQSASDKFAFRTRPTRETSFSIDYDELYELLEYERQNGFIIWVLGPALVFDRDARKSFEWLVENGYVQALFAGNALATHDLEGALYGTALGQDIYSKNITHLGHYRHLDVLNTVGRAGSIQACIEQGMIPDGVMRAVIGRNIPFVLAGSIRDDGPLPEVIADAYRAQDEMRKLSHRATTVIALATQLHAIATGNMVPSYTVRDKRVRPVYFYVVDMSEFAASKLTNRGSLTARSIITNVQDFVVIAQRGLMARNEKN